MEAWPGFAGDVVRIYPVTTKGEIGRCFIEVPMKQVGGRILDALKTPEPRRKPGKKGIQGFISALAEKISKEIADSGDDPLDGDETSRVGRLLTLELDLIQGNITNEEYRRKLLEIEKGGI